MSSPTGVESGFGGGCDWPSHSTHDSFWDHHHHHHHHVPDTHHQDLAADSFLWGGGPYGTFLGSERGSAHAQRREGGVHRTITLTVGTPRAARETEALLGGGGQVPRQRACWKAIPPYFWMVVGTCVGGAWFGIHSGTDEAGQAHWHVDGGAMLGGGYIGFIISTIGVMYCYGL